MELFFDTETSGFLNKNKTYQDPTQGFILQLAAVLMDGPGNIVDDMNVLIKPAGRSIDFYAERVHGISAERAERDGIDELDAMIMFGHLLKCKPTKICHNITFDFSFINWIALHQNDHLPDEIRPLFYLDLPSCCTMTGSTQFCKLPKARGYGYKWPKLEELYKILFHEDMPNAHDAMADVNATIRCYYALKELEVLK